MTDKKIKGKFGTFRVLAPIPRKFKGALDVALPVVKDLKISRVGKSSDGLQFTFSDKNHAIKFSKYMLQQGHKTKLNVQFTGQNTVTIKEEIVQEQNKKVISVGVDKEPHGYLVRLNKNLLFITKDKARNLSRVDTGGGREYVLNKKGDNTVSKMGDTYTITIHNTGRFDLDKKQMSKLKSLIGESKMKIKMSELKEMISEVIKEEENAYQKYFKEKLAGRSLGSMSDEEKKAFFADIDKGWKGKGEKNETLEPVSQAAGKPKHNPTQRVKAQKRDQILASEAKAEQYVRKLVREELKFVLFSEIPGGLSRKRAKKRISQTGTTTKSL